MREMSRKRPLRGNESAMQAGQSLSEVESWMQESGGAYKTGE